MIRIGVILIILWTCASCQTAALEADILPSAQPSARPTLVRPATLAPRFIHTATATAIAALATPAATTPMPEPIQPDPTSAADPMVIGYSVEGRALIARRFGSGERALLLVGGIHGGWEANTVALMEQLIAHFAETPQDIPPGASVIILPNANPDGFEYGAIPRARFNANGVDLNRNWSCDWSRETYWRQELINPGLYPFSEPETQALQAFLLEQRPAAALFYHSAANAIFAGECDGEHGSAALAAALGEATGYAYGAAFSAYPVNGTAAAWADGQGIPAADVELANHADAEYERNLRGVLSLLAWLAGQP